MATKCVCAYSMVKSACTGTVLESVSFVGSSLETSGELADMSVSICLRLYQAAIRAATSCFCSVDSLSHNMFPLALTEQQSCGLVAGEPWSVCGDSGEYDDKSQYLAKLNLVAAALPKNASASPNLFATGEAGAVPEKVTALALCRGDANSRACSSCLANAFAHLPNACPGSKEAVIYYDACMLRYSDIQFLSADDSGPLGVELTYTVRNDANATSEPARYQRAVATLMNATADYAAYNSTRRFEYETKPFINGPVMVQLPATSPSSGAPMPPASATAEGCNLVIFQFMSATLVWHNMSHLKLYREKVQCSRHGSHNTLAYNSRHKPHCLALFMEERILVSM
uniref:Uncharacterized protein n=1 Tax=Aegilops tauschii TaxID=37682 RepID=M8BDH8_AEGTA